MKYWDSSALVPLFVDEVTSQSRRAIAHRDSDIVTWWGSRVECASALSRLHRDGHLDGERLDQSLRLLGSYAAGWLEVEPQEQVRQRAIRLLRLHRLRSADALQLAAALIAAAEQPTTLDLVCSDEQLAAAARREGFQIL